MNVTNVGSNPWYTQSTYQPNKDASDPLRKQFLNLAKNLHDGDMKAAKASMEELKKSNPNKDEGSPLLQALSKAIDSGDVKAARGAFETLLGKAAEAVQKNREAVPEAGTGERGVATTILVQRPASADSGKALDLYA